jgi:hypothetical protein
VRTAEFLEWRFTRRPDAEYAIWGVDRPGDPPGYLVTRVLDIQKYRVLAICDLALEPIDAGTVGSALRHVVHELAGERCDLVMLQGGPPGAASRRALLRSGLLPVPDRALPQPVAVFGGAPGQRGSTAGLPPLDGWCLTPCDWDVF